MAAASNMHVGTRTSLYYGSSADAQLANHDNLCKPYTSNPYASTVCSSVNCCNDDCHPPSTTISWNTSACPVSYAATTGSTQSKVAGTDVDLDDDFFQTALCLVKELVSNYPPKDKMKEKKSKKNKNKDKKNKKNEETSPASSLDASTPSLQAKETKSKKVNINVFRIDDGDSSVQVLRGKNPKPPVSRAATQAPNDSTGLPDAVSNEKDLKQSEEVDDTQVMPCANSTKTPASSILSCLRKKRTVAYVWISSPGGRGLVFYGGCVWNPTREFETLLASKMQNATSLSLKELMSTFAAATQPKNLPRPNRKTLLNAALLRLKQSPVCFETDAKDHESVRREIFKRVFTDGVYGKRAKSDVAPTL